MTSFLTQSANFVISNAAANQAATLAITHTKLYVPVVTLSTQDNAKLLQQLESGFKRRIDWNKHKVTIVTKVTVQAQNRHLDYLIDPNFQGVNRLFVLSFSDRTVRTGYRRYFLPNVQIQDYNIMIDGKDFFDQSVKSDIRTYDNI